MRSRKKTTLAVLRDILGPVSGSETKFAAQIGLSVSWLRKASAGISPLTPETAAKISTAVGVSPAWLLRGDITAPPVELDDRTPFTERSYRRRVHDQQGHDHIMVRTPKRIVEQALVALLVFRILKVMFCAREKARWSEAKFKLREFVEMLEKSFAGELKTKRKISPEYAKAIMRHLKMCVEIEEGRGNKSWPVSKVSTAQTPPG
jgi:transcriptional regulator with XRE-family HTH domain